MFKLKKFFHQQHKNFFTVVTLLVLAITSAGAANRNAQIVLQDSLRLNTQGKVSGGQFLEGGGWQVTGPEDMIVFDLGRYIEDGSVELTVKNFRPGDQNTASRHHFLSMFTNPWGNHHPVEDLETLWDLHAGSNYGGGVKMLSWTGDSYAEKSTVLREAWEHDGPQRLKIAWREKQLQYFRNGRLFLTHRHADDLKLRFLFLGRDLTVSADLVTDFKNNQYPALVGPVYSNLEVRENISSDDSQPAQIKNVVATELYANAAKLAWTTDEPAVCFVEYGLTPAYDFQTPVLGLPAQEFTATLDQLLPARVYHFRLVALDEAGNRTTTPDQTFTTLPGRRFLFKPEADTYVETAGLYGTTRDRGNFGWMNLLAGKGRESYLRFQMAGFNGVSQSATLRLHARKAQGGEIAIHPLRQRWSETETTWQTKPECDSEMVGKLSEVREGEWHDIELNTSLTGAGTYDFALLSQTPHLISLDSRESTNFQPELIVAVEDSDAPASIAKDFTDTFSQNFLDTQQWLRGRNSGNLTQVVQQALELRSTGAQSGWVITRAAFQSRRKMITVKIAQPSNDGSLGISPTRSLDSPLGIYNEPTWYRYYIYRQGNSGSFRLYVQWKKRGVVDGRDITGALTITGEIYLRLRCDENKIYFEASFDHANWHTAYAEPFDLTGYTLNGEFYYELSSYNTEKHGVFAIDDFSIAPANVTPPDSALPRMMTPVFADSFNAGILDNNKWVGASARLTLKGNQLKLQSQNSQAAWVLTRQNFNARHTAVAVRIVEPGNGGGLGMSPSHSGTGIEDESNWYRFYIYRPSANEPLRLAVAWRKNGIFGGREAVNKLAIKAGMYLRLRFDEKKIFFEASNNRVDWIVVYSEAFSLPGYLLRDAFHYELAARQTEALVVDDFTILSENKNTVAPAKASIRPAVAMAESTVKPPAQFALRNYPNPFKLSTQVAFDLPEAAEFELKIYDALGHAVRHLKTGRLIAGRHEAAWDGKNDAGYTLSSGIYFVHLRYRTVNVANWSQLIRRIMILR